MGQEKDPVLEKIRGIREAGDLAFKNGGVKLFGGFSETLRNRFNVSILIHGFPNSTLGKKVIETTTDLSLGSIIAGRDFQLHCTMLEGVWEGENSKDRERIFETLDAGIAIALGNFPIPCMHFDNLVLDASGNLLLMAAHVPSDVLRIRAFLKEAYVRYGLKPLSLDNMFHCTLQRLHDIPENTPESLRLYHRQIEKISREMGEVLLTSCWRYCGSALDLLKAKPD